MLCEIYKKLISRNRFLVVILTVAVLLSGCGGATGEDSRENQFVKPTAVEREAQTGGNILSEDGTWQGEGGCYAIGSAGFGEGARDAYVFGDDIFILDYNWEMIDSVRGSNTWILSRGEEVLYTTQKYIYAWVATAAGIWFIEDMTEQVEQIYHLKLISDKGTILFDSNMTQYFNHSYIRDMEIDREGSIFVALENSVAVFNQDGSYLNRIDLESYIDELVIGGDGKVYILCEDRSVALRIDAQGMTAQQAAEYSGYIINNGGDGYLFTLLNSVGLYGIPEGGVETETIIIWAECGIFVNGLNDVLILPGGRFLLRNATDFYILNPIDSSEFKKKEILTMATVTPWSAMGKIVEEFNLWSDKYVVNLINYGPDMRRFGTEEIKEAISKLNMDIISGNAPDIFDLEYLNEAYYVDKGLLADIYEFLDKDSDISRDDFILLDKFEKDGKLYFAANTYAVESAAGLSSRFGNRFGWTLDEYLEIQSQNSGEIMYNVTKEGFLENLVKCYAATAVDWRTGSCDFENEEFIKILETTAALRENPEPENLADIDFTPRGQRLREETIVVVSEFVNSVHSLADLESEVGEKVSFIGFPTNDGIGGSSLRLQDMAGISTSGNQEGAWEFVKFVMTRDMSRYKMFVIPPYKVLLEQKLRDAMEPLSTTGKPLMGAEDADALYTFLDHAVYYGTASEDVVNIILEEASSFFEGVKTAQETAHVIQSRVRLMVAE